MHSKISVAVVGNFQIGKSTLVNALIGENRAATGRGLSTTKENRNYRLADDVELVDTPGFDAADSDDETASRAIREADLVLFVREGKALDGDVYPRLIRHAVGCGKRGLFLFNCTNREVWAPNEQDHICRAIEGQISPYKDFFLRLDGRVVAPVNALWALYGLGLMDGGAGEEAGNRDQVQRDVRRIESYLKGDLGIEGDLKAEALRLSGVKPVREELAKLPMMVLRRLAENPQSEIDLIVEAFASRFAAYYKEAAERKGPSSI